MNINNDKILIHFDTNYIKVYSLKNGRLKQIDEKHTTFEGSCLTESTFEKISKFLDTLGIYTENINNEHIRLYASGIFQNFVRTEQDKLVNRIFVDYALYFNIIPPDLEQFYLRKSTDVEGEENIMKGLLHQEFRNVVVCGSFQQFLNEIEALIAHLHKYNITILSPQTTKIKPETVGTNFILFDYQDCLKNERDTWRHKYEHMEKFRQADAIIVCDPNGVVGKGTIFEFGFMTAISKRIIFTEKPKSISILFPCEVGLNF